MLRKSSVLGSVALVVAAMLPAVLAGCSSDPPLDETAVDASELRALTSSEIAGTIAYGQTSASVPYQAGYRALSFTGVKGDSVEAWVRSTDGDALGYIATSKWKTIATNDDADDTTQDARLTAVLPASGKYYVVFREIDFEPSTFKVTLTKSGGAEPPTPTPGTSCAATDSIFERSCGTCGQQSMVCIAAAGGGGGTWSDYSACGNEVPNGCIAGTVTQEACGNCGTRTVTCSATCTPSPGECQGEPANACAPGRIDFSIAGCSAPGTYRRRDCGAACTWGNFAASCDPLATTLTVPATVGATDSTIVTLTSAQVIGRLSGTCGGGPSSTNISFTSLTPYLYIEVKNPEAKSAKVSIWNSQAPNGPVLDTVMAAYNGPTAPTDNAGRQACAVGVGDFGSLALVGDDNFASLDGARAVTIPAGGSAIIYLAAYYSSGPSESTGPSRLTVRLDSLE